MPNYHRFRVEGGTYFFTVVTYNRNPILTSKPARQILHEVWVQTQHAYSFETIAVCLLPDHIHTLWKLPDGDSNYSMRWNMIKGCFTRCYQKQIGSDEKINPSRVKRREAAIWHRRFWEHTIDSEEDFENHLDYIHFNPIKHGYVKQASDWEWSSFHRYVKKGLYDRTWAGGSEGRLIGYNFDQ
jgi:putative transposase